MRDRCEAKPFREVFQSSKRVDYEISRLQIMIEMADCFIAEIRTGHRTMAAYWIPNFNSNKQSFITLNVTRRFISRYHSYPKIQKV